jgi:signal-transduction protein with cAMP-binding, CBS, and nucleotidyltransferase domain
MKKTQRILVRKAMRADVTYIDGRKNVLDALRAMRDGKCTSIVVEKRSDHDEHGILTLADIAKKVIAMDRAPERVHVFEIMTKPVISVSPNMDIAIARDCSSSSAFAAHRSSKAAKSSA